MRRENRIPGLVYASGNDPAHIQVAEKELSHVVKKGNPLVELIMPNGQQIMATLKEVQHDPVRDCPVHVDFQEVHAGEVITVWVALHTVGVCKGTKEGGVLDVNLREIEIKGVPSELPDFLEVDVTDLNVGDSVMLQDIPLPEGIQLNQDPHLLVMSVVPPTVMMEETATTEVEEGQSESSQARTEKTS